VGGGREFLRSLEGKHERNESGEHGLSDKRGIQTFEGGEGSDSRSTATKRLAYKLESEADRRKLRVSESRIWGRRKRGPKGEATFGGNLRTKCREIAGLLTRNRRAKHAYWKRPNNLDVYIETNRAGPLKAGGFQRAGRKGPPKFPNPNIAGLLGAEAGKVKSNGR